MSNLLEHIWRSRTRRFHLRVPDIHIRYSGFIRIRGRQDSKPGDAFVRQSSRPPLVPITVYCLCGAKSLFEAMLVLCKLGHWEQFSGFFLNTVIFIQENEFEIVMCKMAATSHHLIEKLGNKTGALSWPDPYVYTLIYVHAYTLSQPMMHCF